MAYDYTKYSYEDLVQEITRLLKEQENWKDSYNSATGQVLIQTLAAIADQLHYMLERRTQESYLPTAKLRSSVASLANSLGYRPLRAISAKAYMELRVTDGSGNTIIPSGEIFIPAHTPVEYDDKNFVTTDDLRITPFDPVPYQLSIKEGVMTGAVFDANDLDSTLARNNFVIIENYDYIDNDSLVIYDDQGEFYDIRQRRGDEAPLESMAFATPDDAVYDLRITDDGLQILFGDGSYGRRPTGALRVEWIESSGSKVFIPHTGLPFRFQGLAKLEDDQPIPVAYDYSLRNVSSVTGGTDPESIESMKRNAPNYIRTGARAVTNTDYEFWAKQSGAGGITDASVYGETELGSRVINANNVYLTYLTSSGLELSLDEMKAFRTYMDNYKGVTTHLVVNAATKIPLQMNIKVKRNRFLTASNREIYNMIYNKVREYFSKEEGSLGRPLYLSDFISYLMSLKMTRDGNTFDLATFVTVEVKALRQFDFPFSRTRDTTATIAGGIPGNQYSFNINGVRHSYNMTNTDSFNSVASEIALMTTYSSAVVGSSEANEVTIRVEDQTRRNLLNNSIDFVDWVGSNAEVTTHSSKSPNGHNNAFKIREDGNNSEHSITLAGIKSGLKTFGIRAKADDRSQIQILFTNPTDGDRAVTTFNLANGTVASGPGSIEYAGNGYYLCKVTNATATVDDNVEIKLLRNGALEYFGEPGKGVLVWGPQLDEANVLTRYVESTGEPNVLSPARQAYTISFDGTTNFANLVSLFDIQIPVWRLDEPGDDMILRGSVELIDSQGNVLATDNNGSIAGGTIDYVSGKVTIPYRTEGTYFFRYSQNTDNNFRATKNQVLEYLPAKPTLDSTVHSLSTIEVFLS